MGPRRTRSVQHQFFIRTSPRRVFRALIEPEWLVRWLADRADMDPRKGGTYLLVWKGGPEHRGDVLECVPGRRLTLAWSWPGVGLTGTRLRMSVRPKGSGTLLEVKHSGFPRTDRWVDLYGGTEWGWTYFFLNLKSVLEQGRDLRSPLDG